MLRIGEFDRYKRHFSYDSGFEVGSTLPRFLSEDGTAKILKCVQTELQKDHGQNTKEESFRLNFIKDKLSTSDGVIFGDGSHVNEEPRNFMLRNIDELKAAGVKKLYLEFVDDKYSWALDEYYESDDMTDLARVVGSSCCCAVETLAIIKKCKENGIRCYGIDDPNPEKTSLAERNKYWADKVKSTNLNNEKYMLFCGSGHLSRSAGNVGIDKILPGKIAALETRIPWKVLNGNVPSSYTSCGDNYSILTYKSH